MRAVVLASLAIAMACDTRAPAADSAAATVVDTVSPVVVNAATDSARHADSLRATGGTTTPIRTPRAATTSSTPTRSPSRTKDTDSTKLPHLGRDSVIRRRPGQLPVDTSKRP